MNFYSMAFGAFLLLCIVIYYIVGKKKPTIQPVVLLCASILFYAWNGKENLLYVLAVSLCVYAAARRIETLASEMKQKRKEATGKEEKTAVKKHYERRQKRVIYGVLVVTLGLLGYLKYWNVLLTALHPQASVMGLVLPLGISYYTFASIGYVLDVKAGKTQAEKSFWKVLLFLIYFPQLIQGPINRFGVMKDSLLVPHRFEEKGFRRGLLRLLYGFFMKYAIANLLVTSIQTIFTHVDGGINGAMVVMGILLYSVQQYTDFAGGIHMVLGISELFGIIMAENFRQPYFATSLGDFWRRWHISLGAWMRDYVFYPLALTKPMQKLGKWATGKWGKHIGRTLPACIANIVVFLCVGLWHGAQAHFLLWGLYNGVVIALSDLFAPVFAKINTILHVNGESRWMHGFRVLRTFLIVNLGWYFDVIEDAGDAFLCLKNTFTNFRMGSLLKDFGNLSVLHWRQSLVYALPCLGVVIIISVLKENGVDVCERFAKLPGVVRFLAAAAMMAVIAFSLQYAAGDGGFLYANF